VNIAEYIITILFYLFLLSAPKLLGLLTFCALLNIYNTSAAVVVVVHFEARHH